MNQLYRSIIEGKSLAGHYKEVVLRDDDGINRSFTSFKTLSGFCSQ